MFGVLKELRVNRYLYALGLPGLDRQDELPDGFLR